MRIRGDQEARDTESGPTTEDIMKSGADEERQPPVYPGEATSERTGGPGVEDPAGTARTAGTAETAEADEPAGRRDARGPADSDTEEPLLGTSETEEYRRKWSEIQGRFVDDPQDAVRSADTLVAEVMQALAGSFSTRKQGLEGQWGRGEQVATEDLRVSLQHYRSFFNRLLKT
ncbi:MULTISPECIES: hypothetical protein [Streptomyces]|uniref:Uncharacterized protein n=1 Tax=Streptomyces virginiae TaxID=1961 RepID=A0ABQ3NMB6_STRVG|nr:MULTISPECIES: hypothetical protein [Streptomyces]KOU80797.1 hypothetical protein ADK94_28580 [Streptomyces sp. XY593]MBP2342202.1 hypothetical protein [Streptomyces virginiae]MCI4079667.1 hypothetical protein [Streptomyces sp. MMS21 TC-5]QNE28995.1 hypothetical protein F1D59_32990 [Streptomyces sp. INR7]GGQ41524.1 hypothetical protein GCM10010215_76340 [Streptomyces virginiae]